ncbi:uncharacterized protein JCM15063_000147 [Sporobolomyces koalae]|uniref:uncharacterized protein n=1 Tax=Sporobolomyces koalae TaxID=500713 RepID=UPI003173643A
MSDMTQYRIATNSNDRNLVAPIESRFRKLLDNLPPSDFLKSLDLAAFHKLQQLTKGEYDSANFDKPAFVKENLAVVKEEKSRPRIEARQVVAKQLEAARCQPSSRPADFALLPMHLWPQHVHAAQPEEGTPASSSIRLSELSPRQYRCRRSTGAVEYSSQTPARPSQKSLLTKNGRYFHLESAL